MWSDIRLWFRRWLAAMLAKWMIWRGREQPTVAPKRLFFTCKRDHGFRQLWCMECGWRQSAPTRKR